MVKKINLLFSVVLVLFCCHNLLSESGYRLWLRYDLIQDEALLSQYKAAVRSFYLDDAITNYRVIREEINAGLGGMLGIKVEFSDNQVIEQGKVICALIDSKIVSRLGINTDEFPIGEEGYLIHTLKVNKKNITLITAQNQNGLLYGAFHFLRLIQTQQALDNLSIAESPTIAHRVLNHWDNLDRTVERGYAGFSIWDWHKLPEYIDQRYIDYARTNASIGINGTVLTNVNSNSLVLTGMYIDKVKALADVFRPYGIRVYLTARFSAPVELGDLNTADPLDPNVQNWWHEKAREIYELIPDFGGFLVKANSEGQPGPQNYGRTHKDGANMLASAVKPYGGIVMWRAFVYDENVPQDRAKQAYNEFKPFDGQFSDNVLIQVKNGPVDFQPREPFHPIFGGMPNSSLMMEFQITQEYLGFSTHLVYLPRFYKEVLNSDTYSNGKGSTVGKIIDGSLGDPAITGIAGVSNIGNDINWCGHPFAQANWYGFGRLAWNTNLSAEEIAMEWIRQTFTNEITAVRLIKEIMMASHEVTVNYMTPLGLHHIMGWDHHYGPAPWIDNKHREDWTSVYYHRADSSGIGFNRSTTGSGAVEQYHKPVMEKFNNINTCPEEFLLWFHHVDWEFEMKSGKTLWGELCHRYYEATDSVKWMKQSWDLLHGLIDNERHKQVSMLLKIQVKESEWWRDACILYFQQFSGMSIPNQYSSPEKPLEYFINTSFPYAPGISPKW